MIEFNWIKEKLKTYKKLHSTGVNINDFSHKEVKELVPYVIENLDVSFTDYGVLIGSRYLLQLNPTNILENIPGFNDERNSKIFVRRSLTETDTIVFEIPSQFDIYKIPDDITINSEFGNYESEITLTDSNLIYVRKLEVDEGVYSKTKFNSFVEFYEQIVKADKTKAVLKRK